MNAQLKSTMVHLAKGPPQKIENIRDVEGKLGLAFPADYIELLRLGDGFEGSLGEEYISIYPLGELVRANEVASEFISGLFIFGSDGGGEAFALDFRSTGTAPVIQIPFILMIAEDIWALAPTLTEWLEGVSGVSG